MCSVTKRSADIVKKSKFCLLLLQVVLSARPRFTTWIRTFERLYTSVYPLMPLQVATGGETSGTYLTDVRFRLALRRSCCSIFSFTALAGLGAIGSFRFDKFGRGRHRMSRVGKGSGRGHVRWSGIERTRVGVARRHGGCLRGDVTRHDD